MKTTQTGRPASSSARALPAIALLLMLLAAAAHLPAQAPDSRPTETKPAPEAYQTLYIANLTDPNDINDLQSALRNMLPKARFSGLPSQHAISIRGSVEDIALAQRILADLDRARKTYRLTFTVSEADGGRRSGAQTYVLVAVAGERTLFKQGTRVPIVTGTASSEIAATQVQYQDVGLSIEATVDARGDGLRLHTKVEQSSLSDEKSTVGEKDPVLHQTVLAGDATLPLGKPLVLGTLDQPGSTRKQEIAVVAELLP